jgi:hypothetical protein
MKFEDLVDKVLHDPGFYSQLKDNPEKALKNAGMEPKPPLVQALKGINYDSLKKVAHATGENLDIC